MTKKKAPEDLQKRGRKSLYNPEIHPKQASDLALMGKTEEEIAKALDVSIQTLYDWRSAHPEFLEAIKECKDQADSKVVVSLYKRACGYEYTENQVTVNPDGSQSVKTVVKHVAPDPTSMIFWLKNRQPKDLRDKRDVELTGKDGEALIPKQMSDEEIIALIRKERESKHQNKK